jgi:hypothetical protein
MKSEKVELRTLWTVKETATYLRKSVKTIKRRLKCDRISGFREGKNGNILIYADTVIEENLNCTRPKFKNNL